VELLRELPEVEAPEDLASRVLARIGAGEGRAGAWARLGGRLAALADSAWVAPAVTAAAAILVLVLVQSVEIEISIPGAALGRVPGVGLVASHREVAPAPSGLEGSSGPAGREQLAAQEAGLPAAPGRGAFAPSAAVLTVATEAPLSRAEEAPPLDAQERAACLEPGHGHTAVCSRLHSWMVGLALRDTPAFFEELDAMPGASREQWLSQLSQFAADSGSALRLAQQLRSVRDPRASSVAVLFERSAAAQRPGVVPATEESTVRGRPARGR